MWVIFYHRHVNYYLSVDVCSCCGRPAEILHIGKSIIGWKFLFKRYKNININTVNDWIKLIETKNNKIFDIYENEISAAEFIDRIDSKTMGKDNVGLGYQSDGRYNYSPFDLS